MDPIVSISAWIVLIKRQADTYSQFQKSEYYDMTLEKTPLQFEGASIFSTLEGVYQHHLTPKYIETALERGSRVSEVWN